MQDQNQPQIQENQRAVVNRLSRAIVQPLNRLNLNDPMSNAEYEELLPLLYKPENRHLLASFDLIGSALHWIRQEMKKA